MQKTVKAWAEVHSQDGFFVAAYPTRGAARDCRRFLYPPSRIVRCTITYEVPEPAKKGKKR